MKLQNKLHILLPILLITLSSWGTGKSDSSIFLPKTITNIHAEEPGSTGRKDVYEFKYDLENRIIEATSYNYHVDYTILYRRDHKKISYNEDGLPVVLYTEIDHLDDGKVKYRDMGEELFSYDDSVVTMSLVGSSKSLKFTIGEDNFNTEKTSDSTEGVYDKKNGIFKNVNSKPWVLQLFEEEYELQLNHNLLEDNQYKRVYKYNKEGYPVSYKQMTKYDNELDMTSTIEYIRK